MDSTFKKIILHLIFAIASLMSIAQNKTANTPPDLKGAKDNFSNGNYKKALNEYLTLLKTDPKNPLYNYRAGVCYISTYIDKTKAIDYLKVASQSSDFEKEALLDLGRAYMYAYKLEDAINTLKKFKEVSGNRPADKMEEADRLVENCYNAKELMKFPVKAIFENLGKDINSEYPDYYPFITGDESVLLYNTRRKGTSGGFESFDGNYTSDVFMAQEKGGKFSKGKTAGGSFNTEGEDEVTGMTQDGNYIFLYTESEMEYGDISVVMKKGKNYLPRIVMDKPVNTEKIEAAASCTDDGNTLFFSSNRSEGEGDFDIYMVRKLPTGQWGTPINLGPNINTKYIEDFPTISPDGKILYFCSQGHFNMGGFDIFKSVWDEFDQKWDKAVNIGYPINTPEDDMTISFSSTGRHAYIASARKGGLGDLDVYRVTYTSVEPKYTLMKGVIKVNVPVKALTYDVNIYKKGAIQHELPAEIVPDASWELVEKKRITAKEGFEIKYGMVCEKNGVEKLLDAATYPQNDPSVIFKSARKTEVPLPPNSPPLFEEKIVSTDMITLATKDNNEVYGTYKTIGETGRYIIIAVPGTYEIQIEADGYEPYNETITIMDMGSSQNEVQKDIMLKAKK